MEQWLKISLILCGVGFFMGMVPSEHFLFQYLTEYQGIAKEVVTSTFYPQKAYFSAFFIVAFLLITDILRYKPVLLTSLAAGVFYYLSLFFTDSKEWIIAPTFCVGVINGAEIGYFTYIYAKVERERYQQVTSNTRSAILMGRCTGAILGQLFVIYDIMNPSQLLFLSFSDKLIAFVIALFLPSVLTSIYFHQKKENPQINSIAGSLASVAPVKDPNSSTLEIVPRTTEEGEELVRFSWKNARELFKSHFKAAYTNKTILLWSIWWILLHTGFNMAFLYNQPLWHYVEPGRKVSYNGFAEAALSLVGALSALLAAKLSQVFIEKWAILIVIVSSLGLGSFAILAGQAQTVFVAYVMYVIIGAVYNFMITVTNAIVAKNLMQDSFAMIFGINGGVGSILVFILNFILTSFFDFNPRELFVIFGGYFYILVAVFSIVMIVKVIKQRGEVKVKE